MFSDKNVWLSTADSCLFSLKFKLIFCSFCKMQLSIAEKIRHSRIKCVKIVQKMTRKHKQLDVSHISCWKKITTRVRITKTHFFFIPHFYLNSANEKMFVSWQSEKIICLFRSKGSEYVPLLTALTPLPLFRKVDAKCIALNVYARAQCTYCAQSIYTREHSHCVCKVEICL